MHDRCPHCGLHFNLEPAVVSVFPYDLVNDHRYQIYFDQKIDPERF